MSWNSFKNKIGVSNSLDPGQGQHFVEPLFAKFVSGPYKQVKN